MEWIIPMIAGLLLDILGVFLIVRPFLRLRLVRYAHAFVDNNEPVDPMKEVLAKIEDIKKELYDDYLFKRKNRIYIKWGFVFSTAGFGLIILASIINYYQITYL